MPVFFKEYPNSYDPGGYDHVVDTRIYEDLVAPLIALGWTVETKKPYFKLAQNGDMVSFGGPPTFGTTGFWAVYPHDWPTRNALMIIDYDGPYTPPSGFEVFKIVDTVDAQVIHEAIIEAFQELGAEVGNFSVVGTDDDDPRINSILQVDSGDAPMLQNFKVPSLGISLRGDVDGNPLNGGYVMRAVPNGHEDNQASFFVGRRDGVDSLNNPGPPVFMFSRTYEGDIMLQELSEGSQRSAYKNIDLTRMDWNLAASEYTMFISEISGTERAHVETVALSLPINGNVYAAVFSVAGNESIVTGFRHYTNSYGMMRLTINESDLYNNLTGKHIPKLLTDNNFDNKEILWENGLGQISEAWVGFALAYDRSAALLGKIPYAIVANRIMEYGDNGIFRWDDANYRVFTNQVTQGTNSQLGTLCLQTNEAASDAECS